MATSTLTALGFAPHGRAAKKADAWLARAIGPHCRRPALRGPLSQLEAIVRLWNGGLRGKRARCVDSRRFRFRAAADSDIVGSSDFFIYFFLFYLLNSIEADEETEAGFSRERAGEGLSESKAEVKVEWEAEAEEEPEGEAEPTITHLPEAERLPDVAHKPSGAHQEGAEM